MDFAANVAPGERKARASGVSRAAQAPSEPRVVWFCCCWGEHLSYLPRLCQDKTQTPPHPGFPLSPHLPLTRELAGPACQWERYSRQPLGRAHLTTKPAPLPIDPPAKTPVARPPGGIRSPAPAPVPARSAPPAAGPPRPQPPRRRSGHPPKIPRPHPPSGLLYTCIFAPWFAFFYFLEILSPISSNLPL